MQPMLEHVPPSSADLVFDDGEPLESPRHRHQMNVLIDSLELEWADRDDFFVGGNMFLYYSETQSKKNDFRGPDVFVVLNTERYRARDAWVVWKEGGQAPDVIIEVLSPSTESIDRNDKMRLYGRTLKVAEYFLFDPSTNEFEGYDLDRRAAEYLRKTPDARGRIFCEQVGLWLGVATSVLHGMEAPWLRWQHENGDVLLDGEERANAATERANVEAERAKAEAERANTETERANVEAERANVEAERANAEAERANAAAERAARLEAELAALRARLEK